MRVVGHPGNRLSLADRDDLAGSLEFILHLFRLLGDWIHHLLFVPAVIVDWVGSHGSGAWQTLGTKAKRSRMRIKIGADSGTS